MVKSPPSNARDAGSIPDWGTKIPHAAEQQLSPCTTMKTQHPQVKKKNTIFKSFLILETLFFFPLKKKISFSLAKQELLNFHNGKISCYSIVSSSGIFPPIMKLYCASATVDLDETC